MSVSDQELDEAIVRHRRGDVSAAEPVYRAALKERPGEARIWHLLGVACFQRGAAKEAEDHVRRALSLDGDEPSFANTLANILHAEGRTNEAVPVLETALKRHPDFDPAAYNLGTLYLLRADYSQAEAVFRALHVRGATSAESYNNFATAILRQYRFDDGLRVCREGLALHPEAGPLIVTFAYGLEGANALENAEELLPRLAEIGPNLPLAKVMRARILRRLRRFEEAWEDIRGVDETGQPELDRIEILYERGMILDALGPEWADRAFADITAYNALLAQSSEAARCDSERFLSKVRAYRRWAEARPVGPPHPLTPDAPVFFVGFPRSGTTLMEQVLKAHPNVLTTEEVSPLVPVEAEARRLAQAEGTLYPEALDRWDEKRLSALRQRFTDERDRIVGPLEGRVLVDKLPLNIIGLGLVAKLWPGARILVALRDPRDACLSCYFQRFKLNDAMANFLDVGQTGRTYAEVMGLWLRDRDTLGLPYHQYR
ncbi:MAG: hypothetical protein A2516_02120, partial [Alphaproteobacteria bacterium RIFOXYD12_FULL_60_8]